jgi:gas vesicle protein
MLRNARTAVKFFVYGVIAGLLFAPQSGAELRKQIFGMLGDTFNDTVSGITGGGQQS